ncbi:MAG TPA: FAD-dependent oxidoreductase, partial [Chryseosolibacter sp.]
MSAISRRQFARVSVAMTSIIASPKVLIALTHKEYEMTDRKQFDVIIVGGSFSGMAAAMALGRALRHVLIIDSGSPCNNVTPASHNFLTQDGKPPVEIAAIARAQLSHYNSIDFHNGLAKSAIKTNKGFEVTVSGGSAFMGKKLIFATGIKDVLPEIKGF